MLFGFLILIQCYPRKPPHRGALSHCCYICIYSTELWHCTFLWPFCLFWKPIAEDTILRWIAYFWKLLETVLTSEKCFSTFVVIFKWMSGMVWHSTASAVTGREDTVLVNLTIFYTAYLMGSLECVVAT